MRRDLAPRRIHLRAADHGLRWRGRRTRPPVADDPQPSTTCASDCGVVYLALTDADGDFMSYTVDVTSLKLERANGTQVETLPATTRIDFAQYVDLTEFFTAATIPNGDYVAATLRLDYSNADITVEQAGAPVAARAVDASGNAIGAVDVRVHLDDRHHLVMAPGHPLAVHARLQPCSDQRCRPGATPVTVTVRPALVASLELVDQKDLRLRGPLVSVDTTAGSYVLDVRPFNLPSPALRAGDRAYRSGHHVRGGRH